MDMLYHRPILTRFVRSSPCGSVTATEATSSGRSQWISRAEQSTETHCLSMLLPCITNLSVISTQTCFTSVRKGAGPGRMHSAVSPVPDAAAWRWTRLAPSWRLGRHGVMFSTSQKRPGCGTLSPAGHRGCSFACGCFCRSTPHSAQLPHRSCKRTAPLPGSARCSFLIGAWSLVAGVPRETLSARGSMVKLWEFLVGSTVQRVE